MFAAVHRDRLFTSAIVLAAAVLFVVRLGSAGVVSEELRWAEVAREMRLTGDYLHPSINGQTYYDKPLGSYWLIVAASLLTGGVTETAARLPAAIAGCLGVWLTISLGRRLFDRPTGLLAGAILATSFGFTFYARRATADVETVTGVLAAVWLYAKYHRDAPGPWIVGLWTIMAATSLTKGLLGCALPAAVFLAHAGGLGLRDRKSWRGIFEQRWLWNRWSLAAIPLAFTLFLTPFLLSMHQSGSSAGIDMLVRENLRRFFAPHNHTGPLHLYAIAIFALLAPWSFFLPAAVLAAPLRGAASTAAGRKNEGLAHVYFWAVFVFFTLSASRRNYYLLPILPAGAILISRVLLARAADLSTWGRQLRNFGYGLFLIAFVAAGGLLLSPDRVLPAPWDSLPPLPGRAWFGVGWGVGLLALGWSWRRSRFVPAVAAVSFAGMAFAFLVVLPELNALRPRHTFAADVRQLTGLESLAFFHARDITFDLAAPNPVPEYQNAAALADDLRAGAVTWVIARRRYLRDLNLPATIVLEEPHHPWEADDQVGDKMILLKTYGTR